jgi:hypothetical protein
MALSSAISFRLRVTRCGGERAFHAQLDEAEQNLVPLRLQCRSGR